MNEAPLLEMFELGDAKEQTRGPLAQPLPEDNPIFPTRNPD